MTAILRRIHVPDSFAALQLMILYPRVTPAEQTGVQPEEEGEAVVVAAVAFPPRNLCFLEWVAVPVVQVVLEVGAVVKHARSILLRALKERRRGG